MVRASASRVLIVSSQLAPLLTHYDQSILHRLLAALINAPTNHRLSVIDRRSARAATVPTDSHETQLRRHRHACTPTSKHTTRPVSASYCIRHSILRVAGVTAGLAESNGSLLPSGL